MNGICHITTPPKSIDASPNQPNTGTNRRVCSSYEERRNTVRGGVRAASQVGMASATSDASTPSTTPLNNGQKVKVMVLTVTTK